jgi:hypothetical protein
VEGKQLFVAQLPKNPTSNVYILWFNLCFVEVSIHVDVEEVREVVHGQLGISNINSIDCDPAKNYCLFLLTCYTVLMKYYRFGI